MRRIKEYLLRHQNSVPEAQTPKHFSHKQRTFASDFQLLVWGSVRPGWQLFTVTVPSGRVDEKFRYGSSLVPKSLPHTLEVIVTLCIQLNVGRIQRDVCSPNHFLRLSDPARLLL